MIRTSNRSAIAWVVTWLMMGSPIIGSEPLKVTTQIAPGPHFVGQGIEIQVEAEGLGQGAALEAPKATNAEIVSLPIDPKRPGFARFVVIAHRAGMLEIPPFRAKQSERSGLSRPTRLTVSNVPNEGRTAAFLGGVGGFEVNADAQPNKIRLGQSIEFQIRVRGQAAWGSDRTPDLSAWKSLGGGLRVEPLPEIFDQPDSPSRTFRYQIRPKLAGRLVLPPVAIAAFDPRTGRFSTRTTSSVPITVDSPPRFDSRSIGYEPMLTSKGAQSGLVTIGLGLGMACLATLALWLVGRRLARPRPLDPSKLAAALGKDLGGDSEVEAATKVVEALTTYLERVGDRKLGVLTPPEARVAFLSLTADLKLSGQAERLIIACDRARYRGSDGDASGLIDEGRAFFGLVAELMGRKERRGEGPREAVETV